MTDENDADFGSELGKMRTRMRLSQVTLASLVSVSEVTLRNWESNVTKPRSEHLKKLIEVLVGKHAFTEEKVQEEAKSFWRLAQSRAAFDEEWFEQLLLGDVQAQVNRNSADSAKKEEIATQTQKEEIDVFQFDTLAPKSPMDTAVLELPPAATGLVGRQEEQKRLEASIFAGKVVEVSGMGGIGKTTLVADTIVRVQDHFDGGIAVVRANEITDPLDIMRKLIERFLPHQQELLNRPGVKPDLLYDAFRSILSAHRQHGKKVLIVIDNIEPPLINSEGLTQLCNVLRSLNVSAILTTRPPLSIQMVHERYELKPFPDTIAADLLIQLLEHSLHHPLTDGEKQDATRICEIIGNHTQAIVLIASYFEGNDFEPIATYRQRLKDSPSIVLDLVERLKRVSGASGGLRLTFASSYSRLEVVEQQMFTALGAIIGRGCTYQAAMALGKALSLTEEVTRTTVNSLRRASLILEPVRSNPRINLHPLVREFAHELLITSSDVSENTLHQALAFHYLEWIQRTGYELLDEDDANISAALQWARTQPLQEVQSLLAQLIYQLRWYWYSRIRFAEAFEWLKVGSEIMEVLGTDWNEMRGELLYSMGIQHQQTGAIADAENCYSRSLAIFDEINKRYGLKAGLGEALSGLAALLQQKGHSEEAEQHYQRSLTVFRELQNQRGEANTLFRLGFLALRTGDTDAAERYYTNSLNIHLKLKDRWGEGIARHALGDVCQQTGQVEVARGYYQEALTICREVQNLRGEGAVLKALGDLTLQVDGPDKAEGHLAQSLIIFQQIFDPQSEGVAMYSMAFLLRQRGEIGRARTLYETSLAIRERVNDERGRGFVLKGLGDLTRRTALRRTNMPIAKKQLEEGYTISKMVKDRRNQGVALKALGDWYWQAGDRDAARKSYEGSLEIRQEFNELRGEAIALKALGDLSLRERDFANADRRLQRSYQIFVQTKDLRGQGVTKHSLGIMAWEHRDRDKARQYFDESFALLKSVQDKQFQGIVLYTLALWVDSQRRSKLDEAEQWYYESLRIATEVQSVQNIVLAKEGLGDFLSRQYGQKRQEASKQLLMEAADLYELLNSSADVQRINEYLKGNKKEYNKDKFMRTLIFDFDEGPNGQGFALSNERRTIDRGPQNGKEPSR